MDQEVQKSSVMMGSKSCRLIWRGYNLPWEVCSIRGTEVIRGHSTVDTSLTNKESQEGLTKQEGLNH